MPHTPGDWSLNKQGFATYVTGPDGKMLAIVREGRSPEEQAEFAANGQLFAAAPALLKVCEQIAQDQRVDLVHSERRLRLYHAVTSAGGTIDTPPGSPTRESARVLLEACKRMLAFLEAEYGNGVQNGYWPEVKPILELARSAVAQTEDHRS